MQVGDYDQAIEMYSLFIKEYGSEDNLKKLEKGDPAQNPPKPADPKKLGERVNVLKQAYDALSAARRRRARRRDRRDQARVKLVAPNR